MKEKKREREGEKGDESDRKRMNECAWVNKRGSEREGERERTKQIEAKNK